MAGPDGTGTSGGGGNTCIVGPSERYPGEYAAKIVSPGGRALAWTEVAASPSLPGDLARGLANFFRKAGDEISPERSGIFVGDAKFPAQSVKPDGFHVKFDENVCDVTGAQGQRYTAPITAMSPGPVPLPK